MNECDVFFKKTYENEINKKMLFYAYDFPSSQILEYTRNIIEISLIKFVDYINVNINYDIIESKDVFQFSNINNATFRLSEILTYQGNPGLSYLDIGKLLLNDGKTRTDVAYIKYGENHAKTSSSLGLSYEMSHITFVSCIGMISDKLSIEEKERLLVRLILRNKLIWKIYSAAQLGNVKARELFYMLSESTYTRRRSNLSTIFKILSNCSEYDFSSFIGRIIL